MCNSIHFDNLKEHPLNVLPRSNATKLIKMKWDFQIVYKQSMKLVAKACGSPAIIRNTVFTNRLVQHVK